MACTVPLQCNAIQAVDTLSVDAPCFDTTQLFESLRKDYKESPIIYGKSSDAVKSLMSLWIHPITSTWTVIATKGDFSCVIGIGTDFKLAPTKNIL
jgi:hypothetical protein